MGYYILFVNLVLRCQSTSFSEKDECLLKCNHKVIKIPSEVIEKNRYYNNKIFCTQMSPTDGFQLEHAAKTLYPSDPFIREVAAGKPLQFITGIVLQLL